MSNSPILHVEDEDASAFLLQAALEQAAIPNRTFRVSSGENALAFLCKTGSYKDAQSPSLVLLDLQLPGIDGWSVLSTMKSRHDLKTIPVVILSASDLDVDRERALNHGANEYIVKQSNVGAMRQAFLNACSGLMSFRVMLEAARLYTLRIATIAFERTRDNGIDVNVARVLPAGGELRLMGTEVASSIAHIRYQGRELWMSLQDLRDNAVLSDVSPPDSPAAPFPSPTS